MLPTLSIGPWQISTYILIYVLAALAADALGIVRLRRLGLPLLLLLRTALVVTVAGFACAYLVRLIPTVQRLVYSGVWDWVGGNSFVGGLIGGSAVLALIFRRHGVPLSRALDQVLPAIALAQAIGRLGCFAAGCCYGRPTDSWLGLYLPDNQGEWAMRYPTQLLHAGADLLIVAVLLAVERRGQRRQQPWPPGLLAWLYVGLYCLERFLIEFLRADALPAFGPLAPRLAGQTAISWAQLYTLAGMILAGTLIARLLARSRQPIGPELEPRGRPAAGFDEEV